MPVFKEKYQEIISELGNKINLVAVSKTKSVEDIQELYELGHRDFGENYVQELVQKHLLLPKDIRWHFIGHLQRNKVKYLVPFIYMIHGVESFKLLEEIDRVAAKQKTGVNCLLQVHIGQEETKFGLNDQELKMIITNLPKLESLNQLQHIKLRGLMGMSTLTEDWDQIRKEFKYLKTLFDDCRDILGQSYFDVLSMGMSNDYKIAAEEGTTLVRIGSLIFGERDHPQ